MAWIEKRMKVPDGKVVGLKAYLEADRLVKAKLFGDFFLYPEEKIDLIEKAIVEYDVQDLPVALNRVVKQEGIELCGITTESLCLLVKQVLL